MTAMIPYPAGRARTLMRTPILLYRLGLGDLLNAIHLMILTTRGRKSGQPRRTAIEYRRHGSKVYVISGWGEQPQWYQNLRADPLATLQLGRTCLCARASIVRDDSEALRVLNLFRRTAPIFYDSVLAWAADERARNPLALPDIAGHFTIVRFDLQPEESRLPAQSADLAWVWLAALGGVVTATAALTLAHRGFGRREG